MSSNRARLLAALCLVVLTAAPAWAGPPFRTDDPEPVELGKWEITLFSLGTAMHGQTSGLGPALEMNYGAAPGVQLHIITPFGYQSTPETGLSFGYGDTELGAKIRLLAPGEDDWYPQIAVFPLVQVPTGNQELGLSTGHVQAFLPVWAQKEFGPWTVYGGGGYGINPGVDQKNWWFAGAAVWRKVTEHFQLGAELFHQSSTPAGLKDTTGFNLGAIYDVSENWHLLIAAGRGLQNADSTNRFSYYAGVQLTF